MKINPGMFVRVVAGHWASRDNGDRSYKPIVGVIDKSWHVWVAYNNNNQRFLRINDGEAYVEVAETLGPADYIFYGAYIRQGARWGPNRK